MNNPPNGNSPVGWGLSSEQKVAFIREMEECGAHAVFYCSKMVEYMKGIGLDAEALPDGSMRLYDHVIRPVEPEWGEPGIYAPSVLDVAISAHGLEISTDMLGRGFGHRHRLEQLKAAWA